jgi:hypothetical protein
MTDILIRYLYQSWANFDAAVERLSTADAGARHDGASRIAWTAGHVTHMVDSWLNVNFQGLAPQRVIGTDQFRSGAPGDAPDWPLVLAGVSEVRERARRLLEAEPDLDRAIAYNGSIEHLRAAGLTLRYALLRIAAHHYEHAGEIGAIRARLGHKVADLKDWGRTLV